MKLAWFGVLGVWQRVDGWRKALVAAKLSGFHRLRCFVHSHNIICLGGSILAEIVVMPKDFSVPKTGKRDYPDFAGGGRAAGGASGSVKMVEQSR
jgi:hypothetical protein